LNIDKQRAANQSNNSSNAKSQLSESLSWKIEKDGIDETLYLIKNGKRIQVRSLKGEFVDAKKLAGSDNYFNNFAKVELSPNKNFLLYWISGWEWGFHEVYNINQEKIVHENDIGSNGFTKDEKYFWECASNEMIGYRYGRIFSLPGFSLKVDLMKNIESDDKKIAQISCIYDPDKNQLRYGLRDLFDRKLLVDGIYDFNTNQDINLTNKHPNSRRIGERLFYLEPDSVDPAKRKFYSLYVEEENNSKLLIKEIPFGIAGGFEPEFDLGPVEKTISVFARDRDGGSEYSIKYYYDLNDDKYIVVKNVRNVVDSNLEIQDKAGKKYKIELAINGVCDKSLNVDSVLLKGLSVSGTMAYSIDERKLTCNFSSDLEERFNPAPEISYSTTNNDLNEIRFIFSGHDKIYPGGRFVWQDEYTFNLLSNKINKLKEL